MNKPNNSVIRLSNYYSYKYGNSNLFGIDNIVSMKCLYKCFPIYIDRMNELDWNSYKLLVRVNNKDERMFYYYVALFFKYSYCDIYELINNDYYKRI